MWFDERKPSGRQTTFSGFFKCLGAPLTVLKRHNFSLTAPMTVRFFFGNLYHLNPEELRRRTNIRRTGNSHVHGGGNLSVKILDLKEEGQ